MDFLKYGQMPELKSGNRTEENEQVVYSNELQNLTKQNHNKFPNVSKLMDKAYTATNEERDVEKAFTKYVEEQEQTYSPLVDRVNKLKQKHKVLAEL